MKFSNAGLTVFLGSLIISSILQATGSSRRSWILEVQLHNYSNPQGAYYDADKTSPYCCCSTLTCYTSNIDSLNCGPVPCTGVLTLCVEDHCIENPVELNMNSVTLGQSESKSLTVYPTFVYKGTSERDTIDLHGSIYHKPSPLPGKGYLIDNFTIPMEFKKTIEFHKPTITEGLHGVISIASAFRFTCDTNFYGDNCSMYCFNRSDDNFICSSSGSKICDEGYTDPDNNCTDKVDVETASSSCAILPAVTTSIIQCTPSLVQQSDIESSSSSISDAAANTASLQSISSSAVVKTIIIQPSSCINTLTKPATRYESSEVVQSSLAKQSSGAASQADALQAHNTSTSVACDSESYSKKFFAVLALLLLTYAGIGILIAIRLMIYFGINKKITTIANSQGTRSGIMNNRQTVLNNPNYDANMPHATGSNNMSRWAAEKSDSVYASLVANEAGQTSTPSDRQYEMIDSKSISSSNIYTFISTQSNDQ